MNEENQIRRKSISQLISLQQEKEREQREEEKEENLLNNKSSPSFPPSFPPSFSPSKNINSKNENQREVNVVSALRLIREVARSRSANGREKKYKQ